MRLSLVLAITMAGLTGCGIGGGGAATGLQDGIVLIPSPGTGDNQNGNTSPNDNTGENANDNAPDNDNGGNDNADSPGSAFLRISNLGGLPREVFVDDVLLVEVQPGETTDDLPVVAGFHLVCICKIGMSDCDCDGLAVVAEQVNVLFVSNE